jgi:hypothetical protein
MVLLPIVERELRRATQRPRTYRVRMIAAAAVALFGMITIWDVSTWTKSASVGRSLFGAVSGMSYWLCLLTGIFTTSVCLSEEKRQGTLGLLFLTDLSGHDVVLGKLATVSLNCVQTLMGAFPVLAISVILGGVSAGEFWRMTAVLLNTLLLSLAAGILASALSVRPGRAIAATVFILVLLTAPSALIDHFLFRELRRFGTDYVFPGPYEAYALVWDGRYPLAPESFWPAVFCTSATSAAMLLVAGRIIPRACLEPAGVPLARRWAWLRRLDDLRDLEAARTARRRMLRINPVFWLELRHRSRWLYLWGLLVLVLAGWLTALACLGFTGRRLTFALFMCLTPLLHAVLKIAIAAAAVTRLGEARRNGELESLLVTPMHARRICRGHMLALRRQFTPSVVLVLLIDASLLLFGHHLIIEDAEQMLIRCLAIWAMMIMLLLDAHALCWLGLWEGLTQKNAFVALWSTLVKLLVVPWPLFVVTAFISPPLLLFRAAMTEADSAFLGLTMWWSVIGFMVDYFCLVSRIYG